ncbi:MAG TPA: NAD(P)-binding domain-containing protein [Rhodocyclaceae bacterium]|nr:NAD(P)-binding domain-containing protein [Rhodocyclaceae bacterium]
MPTSLWTFYAPPLLLLLWAHIRLRKRREVRAVKVLHETLEAGLTEPPSLHPVVDNAICMGSGACTRACPEHALGIVHGKAVLVNPSHCIGHGACAAACPAEAITLVFGTAKRGMDIPYVKPSFETNVPGIFIAGELGGMGLIRKAAEQGKQAMQNVAKHRGQGDQLDVVIVGAGPAGLTATLGAMEHKLRSVTIEQEDSLGGTVYHYPRNKLVMTQPVTLPLVGKAKLGEISKEALLAFWQDIVQRVGMKLNFSESMEKIESMGDGKGFIVHTPKQQYKTRNILLAIGRRGTPRKLGVPGEEHPKVVYRLIDPEQYKGQRVVVVGGGDSAIEAAMAIAEEADTEVILSYRGEAFGRVKPKNRERLAEAEAASRLTVALGSNVLSITPQTLVLEQGGSQREIANDAVIVCAGGILPTPMLKDIGIKVETKFGTA